MHAERRVQLFARSELGMHRLVCTFVAPLREARGGQTYVDDGHGSTAASTASAVGAAAGASALVPTPRHAARFVALLPLEKTAAMVGGGGGDEHVWCGTHALLARGAGDVVRGRSRSATRRVIDAAALALRD
jgi:hypothetical protein